MLSDSINEMKYERAEKAREIEYLKESVLEDAIDDRTEVAEFTHTVNDDSELMKEAASWVDRLKDTDDDKDVEISRIMEATEDLSFDEMAGIK